MNLKYIYIVVYASAFYIIYHSNNYYVELVKKYIFTNVENLYNLRNVKNTETVAYNGNIFTPEELSRYTNEETGLYLSILGKVYDVTKGGKFYGPGGSYNGFIGRDASLAFMTGDFSETGLTDDLSSLSDIQIMQLKDWEKFYDKTYIYKGKLLGRYYDGNGNPTKEYNEITEKIKRGKEAKKKEEQKNIIFPPCNIEWYPETGTRVWCTKDSGGISRNWIGVPRILFEKPNSKQNRCACVNIESKEYMENKGKFGTYKGCPLSARSCNIKNSND